MASGPCSKEAPSASLRSDVCEAGYQMERDEVARWERKMRDSQGVWCLRNGEIRARGFKKG